MKLIGTNQTMAIVQMTPEEYAQAQPHLDVAEAVVSVFMSHAECFKLSGGLIDSTPGNAVQIPTIFTLPAHLAEGGQ